LVTTEPRWRPIFPLGYPAAIDSMTSVAAPLLATVSAGTVVFVASNQNAVRWPNATLALLIGSFLALVFAVQSGFQARLYAVTPSQLSEWFPETDEGSIILLRRNQRYYFDKFTEWSKRARWSYNAGVSVLLLSVVTVVVPRTQPHEAVSAGRYFVIGLAAAGFAVEALWLMHSHRHRNDGVQLPDVGPEWRPQLPKSQVG
jgi:hypothetical protein